MKRILAFFLILFLAAASALAEPLPLLEDYAEDLVIPYDEADPSFGTFSYSYRYPPRMRRLKAVRRSTPSIRI